MHDAPDAAPDRRLQDVKEHLDTLRAVREGLADVDAGRTTPLNVVFARLDRERRPTR